jgi:hypothetical protein
MRQTLMAEHQPLDPGRPSLAVNDGITVTGARSGPAIDPADAVALTACVDHVLDRLY